MVKLLHQLVLAVPKALSAEMLVGNEPFLARPEPQKDVALVKMDLQANKVHMATLLWCELPATLPRIDLPQGFSLAKAKRLRPEVEVPIVDESQLGLLCLFFLLRTWGQPGGIHIARHSVMSCFTKRVIDTRRPFLEERRNVSFACRRRAFAACRRQKRLLVA